jgi:hypothetical protein
MLFLTPSRSARSQFWSHEMNPSPTLRRPLSLVAVLWPLILAACGRVPGQFEILNDQIPQVSGTGCIIPVDPGMYSGEGKLDISIVRGDFESAYFVFPLIENNLPAAKGTSIDPNEIQLTGFQVDVRSLDPMHTPAAVQAVFDGAGAFAHYQVPWSGGIASGGGQLSAAVAAFPVELAQAVAGAGNFGVQPSLTVDLQVAVLGTTNSGQHMTSDPFHFPVQLCSGCLVANKLPCPYTTVPTNLGNGCNPAQDDPIDCCTDSGALVCPPTVALP